MPSTTPPQTPPWWPNFVWPQWPQWPQWSQQWPPWFPPPFDSNGGPTRGLLGTDTGSDLQVLQSAVRILRSIRPDLANPDPKVAAAAGRRVVFVVAYILGALDAVGAGRERPTSGLDDVLGAQQQGTSLATLVDDLIRTIDELLSAPPETRAQPNWKHVAGAALVAIGAVIFAAF